MCRIEGCERKSYAKDLCGLHYDRIRRCGVYEFETPMERIADKIVIDPIKGCWIWMGSKVNGGYGVISTKESYHTRVHRYVYEFYHGKIPEGLYACHKCDNPSCVNPDHIFLGTQGENLHDAVKKGRTKRGENHFNAKVTEKDIYSIRSDERLFKVIALQYNISRQMVGRIKSRKRWGWLNEHGA